LREILPDELPPLLREVAALIGVEPALALARAGRGRDVYVPDVMPADHWIVLAIGMERARIFARRYGRDTLTLPTAKKVLAMMDAARLHDEGRSVPVIAARLKLTTRHVRRLLRNAGVGYIPQARGYKPEVEACPACGHRHRPKRPHGPPDGRQLQLF